MTNGVVSAIQIHPIKSCHRVDVTSATVSATGLEGDRQWQVAGEAKPVTQRQKAVLATVRPEPIEGGLRISAPDRPTVEVATPTITDAVTNALIGVPVDVADAGDEAASWFSQLLDLSVRLFARTAESHVKVPSALDIFDQAPAFADLAPVLVTNSASLAWLAAQATEPFDMARFRPNLVIDTDEPFAEETWARFSLGDVELRHGMAWPRCAVPQVDQESGNRNREPALVLKTHRFVQFAPSLAPTVRPFVEGNTVFGVGCAIGPVGSEIHLGDALRVTETMEPLLAPPPA